MIELIYLIIVVIAHWIADFVCQTDEMAKNKSKSNKWLGAHVITYSIILGITLCLGLILAGIAINLSLILLFVMANGALHFIIDYFTSRLSSKLYAQGRVHDFFVVIGFDQMLHILILIITTFVILAR